MDEENRRVDSQYYEVVPSGSIAARLLLRARESIYGDFILCCSPSANDQILDVGVSDIIGVGDNVLERSYPHQEQLTAVGLGEGAEFVKTFPATRYLKIGPNQRLPFVDNAFRIVFCNAVIEHVGSTGHQRSLISELLRVGASVFLVAPNRYFPVEHHTAIPFFNWTDLGFKLACKILGKHYWARRENLILMSRSSLSSIVPPGCLVRSGYTGIKIGPFSSNIFVLLARPR